MVAPQQRRPSMSKKLFPVKTSFTGQMVPHQSRSLLLNNVRVLLSTIILVGFIPGCTTNLKAIQDFANLSAESAEYTTLVDNYLEFPTRQKHYQPSSRHATLDSMAEERATQKEALLLRQAIVETYMNALGRLAADEIVDNTEELAKLTTALQTQAGTSPQETEAYEKIAGILTRVAGDRWRQGQLQDLIEQANSPIQRILAALHHIVTKGFGGDLQTEEAAIQNHYTTLIMESTDPAGKAALAEWKDFRMSQAQERSQAVQAYGTVLKKISDEHQELFDRRHELDSKQLLQHVANSVKDLRTLLETIKTL
jgi:hypothetical protein